MAVATSFPVLCIDIMCMCMHSSSTMRFIHQCICHQRRQGTCGVAAWLSNGAAPTSSTSQAGPPGSRCVGR